MKFVKIGLLTKFHHNFKKLLAYKASYLQTQFKRNFQQMVVFQN